MILIPASRQILNASASLGTISRAAGVSIAAPDATKSFCMSTTIIAVLFGSITSMFMAFSGQRESPVILLARYYKEQRAKHLRPTRQRVIRSAGFVTLEQLSVHWN